MNNFLFYAGPELFCVAARISGLDRFKSVKKVISSIENMRTYQPMYNQTKPKCDDTDYYEEYEKVKRKERQESDDREYIMKKQARIRSLEIQEFSDLGHTVGGTYSYYDD